MKPQAAGETPHTQQNHQHLAYWVLGSQRKGRFQRRLSPRHPTYGSKCPVPFYHSIHSLGLVRFRVLELHLDMILVPTSF